MRCSLMLLVACLVGSMPLSSLAEGPDRVAGRTLGEWTGQLESRKRSRRLLAVLTLPSFGAAAVEPLARSLGHSDEAIRYWAASGLGDLAHKSSRTKTVLATLENLAKHKSIGLRASAAYALCRLGKAGSGLPVLIKALEHPQRGVACSAADFLARIGPPAVAAVEALQAAMMHKDYHVKGAAREALRRIRVVRQEEK